MGTLPPAFSLAKVLQGPSMIAADIAENWCFKLWSLHQLFLINQKSRRTFLDKSSLISVTTLTKTSVTDVTLPDMSILNLSIGHYVQQVIADALPIVEANKAVNQSASTLGDQNSLVCWLLLIRNGVARKLSKPPLSMNSFNLCVSMSKEEDPSVDEEARMFRKIGSWWRGSNRPWQWFRDESLQN